MKRRDEILAQVLAIPALPSAAVELLNLIKDPEVNITKVTKTIEFDPALTTNVLHLANSAYFGGPKSVASIKEAIVRLGLNRALPVPSPKYTCCSGNHIPRR